MKKTIASPSPNRRIFSSGELTMTKQRSGHRETSVKSKKSSVGVSNIIKRTCFIPPKKITTIGVQDQLTLADKVSIRT